nr:class II aldolase/adducin family protein [Prochloraceae cyanobacterium]
PDVIAAAHAHSLYGKTFSTLGTLLEPLTQDACAFYEDHALFDDYTGIVLDTEEGQRIATALGPKKAVILRNHGLLTVGHSVDEAAWWFITMERSCQSEIMARSAGNPTAIDPETARLTGSKIGSHLAGWFSFQSLYQKIVREEPDLLD